MTYSKITKEDNYRKIEAMYRKNCSTEEIMAATGLSKHDVIDVEQLIFGRDMMKKERERKMNYHAKKSYNKY